jgi:hypothetical protein
VPACRNMTVLGERGKMEECMSDGMRQLRLRQEDAQDRAAWRNGILENRRPTRASAEIWSLNR